MTLTYGQIQALKGLAEIALEEDKAFAARAGDNLSYAATGILIRRIIELEGALKALEAAALPTYEREIAKAA
jgi:hypothetical protein